MRLHPSFFSIVLSASVADGGWLPGRSGIVGRLTNHGYIWSNLHYQNVKGRLSVQESSHWLTKNMRAKPWMWQRDCSNGEFPTPKELRSVFYWNMMQVLTCNIS